MHAKQINYRINSYATCTNMHAKQINYRRNSYATCTKSPNRGMVADLGHYYYLNSFFLNTSQSVQSVLLCVA